MINTFILTVDGQIQSIEGKQFIIENTGSSEVKIQFSSSTDVYDLAKGEKLDLGPFEVNLVDKVTVDFSGAIGLYNEVQILQLK